MVSSWHSSFVSNPDAMKKVLMIISAAKPNALCNLQRHWSACEGCCSSLLTSEKQIKNSQQKRWVPLISYIQFCAIEKISDHLQSSSGDFIIPNALVGGHVLYIGWNELAPPDVLFLAFSRKIGIHILVAFPFDQWFSLLHFDNGLL